MQVIAPTDKIKTAKDLEIIRGSARQSGRRVVFTNGCYDLLHVGHVRYLDSAARLGDILVVGVNSDNSVRQIKGALRPIQGEEERSEVIAALHCVDYVTIFDTPDPLPLIELLMPDVLVKGADWPMEKIIGADVVQRGGGTVARIPLTPRISTTRIIENILARFADRLSVK